MYIHSFISFKPILQVQVGDVFAVSHKLRNVLQLKVERESAIMPPSSSPVSSVLVESPGNNDGSGNHAGTGPTGGYTQEWPWRGRIEFKNLKMRYVQMYTYMHVSVQVYAFLCMYNNTNPNEQS
jgi:hypothetical protein